MDGGRRCRYRVIKQLVGKTRVSSHQGQRSHFKCIDTRFPRRGDGGGVGRISRQYRTRRLELPDRSPRRSRGAREARVAGLGLCLDYDFLPSIAVTSDKAKSVARPRDGTVVAEQAPQQAAAISSDNAKSVARPHDGTVIAEQAPQVAQQAPQVAPQPPQQAAAISNEPKASKW